MQRMSITPKENSDGKNLWGKLYFLSSPRSTRFPASILKGKKYTSLERDHIYWEGRFFIWYLSMRVYKHKAGKNQTLDHQSLYKFVWTKQSIHSLALNQPHQLQTDRLDSTVDLTTSNINFKIFWCGDYAKSKTTEGYFGSVPFFPSQPPIDHRLFFIKGRLLWEKSRKLSQDTSETKHR